MKKTYIVIVISLVVCLGIFILAMGVFAQKGKETKKEEKKEVIKYIGATTGCICHKNTDNSFDVLSKTKHGTAFESLKTPAAKKLSKDPLKDPKCLKCHTTGYGEPGGYDLKADEKIKKEMEGVKCEACHGAGEKYKVKHPAISKTKDPKKKEEAGKIKEFPIKPDEKVCAKCHSKESPTYKSIKFDEAAKAIKHGEKKTKK